ncbi:MAG: hypothetical protein H6865_08235 [Rhodospirillales bacterium]|nr:hypothetical protein [Alphaproteobacteria bacterium]MCB9987604.1 hypothetical protein [Rhodospirillales bacterium]USO07681.1 MAG: hypothetical protein H6866_00115 [Rhodospirillales bacterium]
MTIIDQKINAFPVFLEYTRIAALLETGSTNESLLKRGFNIARQVGAAVDAVDWNAPLADEVALAKAFPLLVAIAANTQAGQEVLSVQRALGARTIQGYLTGEALPSRFVLPTILTALKPIVNEELRALMVYGQEWVTSEGRRGAWERGVRRGPVI